MTFSQNSQRQGRQRAGLDWRLSTFKHGPRRPTPGRGRASEWENLQDMSKSICVSLTSPTFDFRRARRTFPSFRGANILPDQTPISDHGVEAQEQSKKTALSKPPPRQDTKTLRSSNNNPSITYCISLLYTGTCTISHMARQKNTELFYSKSP